LQPAHEFIPPVAHDQVVRAEMGPHGAGHVTQEL
jgi:hypothetical protein